MTDQKAEPCTVALVDLPSMTGSELTGSTSYLITQERINWFAEVTEDRQWIHVDVERAKTGPFGSTIAHGFLTLSLGVELYFSLLKVTGVDQVINYGLEKVRFLSPVLVGSELSARATVDKVTEVRGGYQVTSTLTFETGGERPACVATIVMRYLGPMDTPGSTS